MRAAESATKWREAADFDTPLPAGSHADLTKTTERGAIELQEEELKGVTGGRDGSLEAGVHFKYDLKGQKEG